MDKTATTQICRYNLSVRWYLNDMELWCTLDIFIHFCYSRRSAMHSCGILNSWWWRNTRPWIQTAILCCHTVISTNILADVTRRNYQTDLALNRLINGKQACCQMKITMSRENVAWRVLWNYWRFISTLVARISLQQHKTHFLNTDGAGRLIKTVSYIS